MSIDGYIDDASAERLRLSNEADFDRVDAVRATCDAILVGAATIRRDDPRLLVRSQRRREARVGRGLPPSPLKVTVSGGGDLDPAAQFFTAGDVEKIVYSATGALGKARERLGDAASVVDAGEPLSFPRALADLAARGVGRLMVEGGGGIHTAFLTAGLADELQLVVAPFFVGDAAAPRFVADGAFPWTPRRPARLVEVRQLEDVVLLRYALSDRYGASDRHAPSGNHAPPNSDAPPDSDAPCDHSAGG
ncbi:dihydrofolate reductase family protein [Frankia sp. CNm7]|uniref:Dihydrofolate reductase family protein n=2 Tax=Frankia nepalensis TaxID=1836974 RepID=A0A937RMQ6_9ACTN|nr:dihydrofolate reductase family protein [Frankia nepalensis]MBL7515166.1 dihydrofolate reductase family protein [Frankia nepalensis]MBL7524271.1 dihydrofolate reductase family protein [Frankia nepalensis]MBL7629243.1 dihydrofolate reductase family protein [Frankia nepalensis]